MKVGIMRDEKYPVYSLVESDSHGDLTVEVPEATLVLWKAVIANFDKVQEEMGKLFERKKMEKSFGRKKSG